MRFVWNDETTINCYGFIVKNSGGDFSRMDTNPVMLLMHDHAKVIGSWGELTTEGSLLSSDAQFDEADPEALAVKGKVDRGFLKGCSMGFEPTKWELSTMPDGSVVPIVTAWTWVETSLVSIPGNSNSLRLYQDGKELSELEIRDRVLTLTMSHKNSISMEKNIMTAEAYKALQLGDNADATAVSAAIVQLSAKAAAGDLAVAELTNFKKGRATALVDQAVAEGRLTADKKDAFVSLALSDFAQASTIILALPKKQSLADRVVEGEARTTNRESWTLTQWRKEDPAGLQLLKKNHPEQYQELVAAVDAKLRAQGTI